MKLPSLPISKQFWRDLGGLELAWGGRVREPFSFPFCVFACVRGAFLGVQTCVWCVRGARIAFPSSQGGIFACGWGRGARVGRTSGVSLENVRASGRGASDRLGR